MKTKSKYEEFGETLRVEDAVKFLKAAGFKYITKWTVYDEDGLEMQHTTGPKNPKLVELKKKWKSMK